MATFNELKFNIINIIRGGISSDDDRLSERQVGFWINYYRSKLIYEYFKSNKPIDRQLIQDLGTLKLETIDVADSTQVVFGRKIKRVKIPKLVELPKQKALTFIGLADKITPIIYKEPEIASFSKFQKFGKHLKNAYMIGDYIHILEPINEDIQYINVRGLFADPFEASKVADECGGDCITDDSQYPFPEYMIADMVKLILSQEFNLIRMPNDETNNGVGEAVQSTK